HQEVNCVVSSRIAFSWFLFRLAGWIQSLPVFLMKPGDLIDFGRRSYARPNQVRGWSEIQFVSTGLFNDEVQLLEKMPVDTGRLLLLGVGGGREAIPLAQKGYEVIGVDFVAEMVAQAKANARRHNVEIGGLVQDISQLEVSRASFDVIWFSTALYSAIPTRRLRVSMLQRIHLALRDQGCVVCQFSWNPSGHSCSLRRQRLGALVALLTFGNRQFEDGDQLLGSLEFIHSFHSENELRSEFEAAGFSVQYLNLGEQICMGEAILVKGSN